LLILCLLLEYKLQEEKRYIFDSSHIPVA
jgi:hypothetical protein